MNHSDSADTLRDFSADSRIFYISLLAAALGALAALLAWVLDEMVSFFTNLFYFQRWSFVERPPWEAGRHWWLILMPVLGGVIVGLIARYLSPRVRGHGLPEAIETVVFNGGKVQPRVAVLKPVATAIAIGSGGPFGTEGPVIISSGAAASVVGQLLSVTSSERTVVMVSGAAAGMAAMFNCPMSATLLAVECLLFEWKPRSLVPVAIACVSAGAVRRLLLGPQSLLHMAPTGAPIYHSAMLGALALGLVAALLSSVLSKGVRFFELMFEHLPVHWMWWPAIGGVVVGLCGYIFPESLGVGYSVIQQMISGNIAWTMLAGILLIKTMSWSFAMGSNTAAGILAPLLMIGGALGGLFAHLMPLMTPGAWVLVGMSSVFAAASGAPLTSAMLALELTHNGGLMLPVLLSCMAAYAVSVLVLPRSMLTESMSRRGMHLSREFGSDPLESVLVSHAMHTSVFALPESATRKDAAAWLSKMEERGGEAWSHWQRIFPLVDSDGRLIGALTRAQMIAAARKDDLSVPLAQDANTNPITVSPTTTLRACAMSMAESTLTSYPVVDPDGKLVGIMTINDLLKGRSEEAHRETDRERILRLRWPFGHHAGHRAPASPPQTIEDECDEPL